MRPVSLHLAAALAVLLATGCKSETRHGADAQSAAAAAPGEQAAATRATPTEPAPEPVLDGPDPLGPVATIMAGVETALVATIRGEDAALGQGTVRTGESWGTHLAELRSELRAAGVADAKLLGFEYELILRAEGKPDYYLRAYVYPQRGQARVLGFEGKERERVAVKSRLPMELRGGLAPVATATHDFLALLAGPDGCDLVPLVDPAPLREHLTFDKMRDGLDERLAAARAYQTGACAELAARTRDRDRVRIRLDDVGLLAFDAAGTQIGVISAGVEIASEGTFLELEGAGLRRFEK